MTFIEVVSVSAITSAITVAAILFGISYLVDRVLKKRKRHGQAHR